MNRIVLNAAEVRDRSEFVSKVYTILGISLLLCCAGAYFGLSMPTSLYLPIIILEFVFLIACMLLQRSFPINILLLALFTSTSGLTLGPVLNSYVAQGMGDVIPMATGITALTFGGLSMYVHLSKKDFSFLSGFLFIGLIGLILVSLASFLFHFPVSTTLYSAVGILIFSGYILVDTSNLLHRYRDEEYVAATIALYLDLINLFLFILRLLADRRR